MPEASCNQIRVIKAVGEKYLLLKRIAYGGNGVVDFAIAEKDIPEGLLKPGEWDNLVNPVDRVRKDLVAIKYPYGFEGSQASIRAELGVLKEIRNFSVVNKASFVELIGCDEGDIEEGKCHYIITKAVSTGLCLAQLANVTHEELFEHQPLHPSQSAADTKQPTLDPELMFKKVFPMSLLCHTFLELGSALQTLHDHGIRHGDFKAENIMIKYSEAFGWPQFILIDFGCGSVVGRGNNPDALLQGDREKFCKLIHQYAKKHTVRECYQVSESGEPDRKERKVKDSKSKKDKKSKKGEKATVIRRFDAEAWEYCEPHPESWDDFVKAMKNERRATSQMNMRDILKRWKSVAKEGREIAGTDMKAYIGKVLRAAVDIASSETGILDVELKAAIQNPKRIAYRHMGNSELTEVLAETGVGPPS